MVTRPFKSDLIIASANDPEGKFVRIKVDELTASTITKGVVSETKSDTTDSTPIFKVTNNDGTHQKFKGSGSPEGVITGNIGDCYIDYTNGKMYIKASGTGDTGWEVFMRSNDVSYKSYFYASRTGSSGKSYLGGFYYAPAADADLSESSTTQTIGSSNTPSGAHAFIVASEEGTTDGTDLVLTVSGTSITDAGVRTTTDSEVIVADCTASTTDKYYETTKKWIGTVTFTLSSTGGTTYAYTFNYGLAKYEDFSNRNFVIDNFEVTGIANASDTGFNIELLHHKSTGWTYHATAFVPGSEAVTSLASVYVTEDNIVAGEQFGFKVVDIDEAINGEGGEGCVVRVTTTENAAVSSMTTHLGVTFA